MPLSEYHKKYSDYSNNEIQKRAEEKEVELEAVFKRVSLNTGSAIVRLAVIGSGDKRFVKIHKRIFEKIIQKPVEVSTFDIEIDHLSGEEKVIQHDCTKPLPNAPYDITYAHVLLKFIETEKQWDLLNNYYDALKTGGLAIHLLDSEDYGVKEAGLPNGIFFVPLDRWKVKLDELGVEHKEVPVKYGLALVIWKK
jgi:hypothetical protein